LLEERFGSVAEHLSNELDIDVAYVPVTDYATLVTAFKNGDITLAWFGGLTGLQALSFTPDAIPIVQRPRDREFTSVFIVGTDSTATSLVDLKGETFTFGSTNSTSGHLMPRSFLLDAGVDPDVDFKGVPNYSGSHDLTWKLVECGSFEAGALNSAVWDRAIAEGRVDLSKVKAIYETPEYVDYNWVAHPDIETRWNAGTTAKIKSVLLDISAESELEKRILEMFETDSFVEVNPSDYAGLEQIARSLNMLQ
jgi:phosphonate transport system substrate-binding protein